MADPQFYIYVLFRETGVPFYIGKGKGKRWLEHERRPRHRHTHKNAIIRKMQAAGFDIPKIKLHENLAEAIALAYESALIIAIGRADQGLGPLANQTDGGEGRSGWIATPEARAKLSAALLGRKHSAEHRAKTAALKLGNKNWLGRKHSVEARAKIAAARSARVNIEISKEHREKISAALRGRKVSIETRAKLSKGKLGNKLWLGRRHSVEARTKMAVARATQPPRGVLSKEHRAKLSLKLSGREFSAEHRAKIAAAKLGVQLSAESVAKREATKRLKRSAAAAMY